MEIWKDVIGFKNYYQVSNLGNVKSLARKRRTKLFKNGSYKEFIWGFAPIKERILVPTIDNRKRKRVLFTKDTIRKKFFISVLVAQTFIEYKVSDGKTNVVNHIDNNPSNNYVENLEWITQKQNIAHSIKQDRHSSVTRWQDTV